MQNSILNKTHHSEKLTINKLQRHFWTCILNMYFIWVSLNLYHRNCGNYHRFQVKLKVKSSQEIYTYRYIFLYCKPNKLWIFSCDLVFVSELHSTCIVLYLQNATFNCKTSSRRYSTIICEHILIELPWYILSRYKRLFRFLLISSKQVRTVRWTFNGQSTRKVFKLTKILYWKARNLFF